MLSGFTVVPWEVASRSPVLPWNLMEVPNAMLADTKKADAANSLRKPIDRKPFRTKWLALCMPLSI
jgi:hypothetical protein